MLPRPCLHLPSQGSGVQVIQQPVLLARCSFPLITRLQQSQCLHLSRASYISPSYGMCRHRPWKNTRAGRRGTCGYTPNLRHITIWKNPPKGRASRSAIRAIHSYKTNNRPSAKQSDGHRCQNLRRWVLWNGSRGASRTWAKLGREIDPLREGGCSRVSEPFMYASAFGCLSSRGRGKYVWFVISALVLIFCGMPSSWA